jgi:Malectin domain
MPARMAIHLATEFEAEKAEYQAVISAGVFPPLSNGARFLAYVSARYFAHEVEVNEYSIGVHALGRRKDFDPKQDAIVRVEAHRARKRLAEYYANEGAHHKLRLTIPHGSYLPVFVPHESAPAATPSGAGISFFRSKVALFFVITVLFGAGGIGALVWRSHSGTAVNPGSRSSSISPPGAAIPSELRILAGSRAEYKDRLGRVWSPDRFFTGGQYWTARYRRILRTRDPDLFLSARQGREFHYDIPLNPGNYELRLYFAETYFGEDNPEGGGESSRMFNVTVNGATVLDSFDPLSDADGSNTADVRVFRGISPAADGQLHLRFFAPYPLKSVALVSGIEVVPANTYALRWVASDNAVVDSASQLWQPDQFSLGGRICARPEGVKETTDPSLYRSERYGHFSYSIPVPAGAYTLTLYFAEQWFGIELFGGGAPVGRRVFDVYCNGVALLRNFDISKEAGGSLRAIRRRFRGLRPNAQGKLIITFVPIRDYALLNALELTEENKNQ